MQSSLAELFDQSEVKTIYEPSDFHDEDRRFKLISGHIGYASVEFFESQNPFVMTFLREPVDRAVSAYYFFRELENDNPRVQPWLQGRKEWLDKAKKQSLYEFISDTPSFGTELGSGHILNLTNKGSLIGDEVQTVTRAHLNQAISNLEKIDFVGITERMQSCTELLSSTLGTPIRKTTKMNVTSKRPHIDDLDRKTRQALLEITQYDRELYVFALKLFSEKWQKHLAASMPCSLSQAQFIDRFQRSLDLNSYSRRGSWYRFWYQLRAFIKN